MLEIRRDASFGDYREVPNVDTTFSLTNPERDRPGCQRARLRQRPTRFWGSAPPQASMSCGGLTGDCCGRRIPTSEEVPPVFTPCSTRGSLWEHRRTAPRTTEPGLPTLNPQGRGRPVPAGGGGAGRAGSPGASGPGHSGPRARTYGHPGGHARQQYLALVREWAGRGTSLQDPYDPELVRAAPREIRRTLAKALAEEATAQLIAGLGIGFTAWHDVDPGRDARKLDHVVLGPAGLFAVLSEDWGGIVQLRRGELVGDVIDPGEEPMAALERSARSLARSVKVRFTALVITVPDGSAEQPFTVPGRGRRPTIITVPRSRLVGLLRDGLPGMERGSFEKVFELRSRLQNGVRFIAD
jgi:hypothetical protein